MTREEMRAKLEALRARQARSSTDGYGGWVSSAETSYTTTTIVDPVPVNIKFEPLSGERLDHYAYKWLDMSRTPGETCESFRERIRQIVF